MPNAPENDSPYDFGAIIGAATSEYPDQSFQASSSEANTAPTAVSFANAVAITPENGGSIKVADIVVTDDGRGTNILSLSGTHAAWFSIVSGALYFNGGGNFEQLAAYDVTVSAMDPALTDAPVSQSLRLALGDVAEAQTFIGTDGDDTLNVNPHSLDSWKVDGGKGNDLLVTGPGIDHVIGGVGDDTISGGDANDNLLGGSGADTIDGGSGDDVIQAGIGADILQGGSGNDYIDGNADDDTISGGSGEDVIIAGSGSDSVLGNDGNDEISGNDNSDTLDGGNGDDVIDGGAGNDDISGGMGVDLLTGGSGLDFFRGTASELSGDTITDFSIIDRIAIADASVATFSYSMSGSTLTYTGGTLTLSNLSGARLAASSSPNGGVTLRLIEYKTPDDFNGDGRSDILWRNADGTLSSWLGGSDGGFIDNGAAVTAKVALGWTIAATGNFNGDARADILWRHTDGSLSSWLGTVGGGFLDNGANAATMVATSWNVAGTGDFNGDGRDDILWRNDDGSLSSWLGTATGGFADNGANAGAGVATSWHVAGTGDFNGDGRDDILWRNDDGTISTWLGTATGGFLDNGANSVASAATSWNVAGIGDFNGDARADILWRNDDGSLTTWLGTSSGNFADNSANAQQAVSTDWSVENVGDYNGDGRSDILWRHADGRLVDWLGAAGGGFVDNGQISSAYVPSSFESAGLGDFNGDGITDVLWRSASALTDSLGTVSGLMADNDENARAAVSGDWQVDGTGDFNGDGRDDILWRNEDGALSSWLGNANGGFTDNGPNAGAVVATSWHIAGTGDFNGDGRDDILWRNDSGALSSWLGTASGGFADNGANAGNNVATSWHVVGTGDFNGDGRDDILWRNDDGELSTWHGTSTGRFADNGVNAGTQVATSWHVAGTGDFNGDGRDDILWRNDDGQLSNWLGTDSGRFTDNGAVSGTSIAPSREVAGTGDVNGDGYDDILWLDDNGQLFNWLGTQSGAFVDNEANSVTYVPLDWVVQSEDYFMV